MYLVGQIGDQQLSMHGEKGRVVIQTPDGRVQEMDFENLGMGTKGVEDGRDTENREEKGLSGASEEDTQGADEDGPASESGMGSRDTGGEGESASNSGVDVGILDGTGEERGGGGQVGSAALEGVADVATGPVGDDGGFGEATPEPEEAERATAAGGRPEGVEQKDPGFGEGSRPDERPGEVVTGSPRQPGCDEEV